MFKTKNTDPIVIVVKDGRWDAFAKVPATKRDHWLLSLINQMGGINENVAEGRYNFNAKRIGFKIHADLTKIEE